MGAFRFLEEVFNLFFSGLLFSELFSDFLGWVKFLFLGENSKSSVQKNPPGKFPRRIH
jgi:hypothetical protein